VQWGICTPQAATSKQLMEWNSIILFQKINLKLMGFVAKKVQLHPPSRISGYATGWFNWWVG